MSKRPESMTAEEIARVCHEVNAGVCRAFGDHSQLPWEEAPEWQRQSAVRGVEFAVTHPDAPDSAQHDAWVKDKLAEGWRYGPAKDPGAKTHPCLVLFDDLPPEQRLKDTLFRAVVKALAREEAGAPQSAGTRFGTDPGYALGLGG